MAKYNDNTEEEESHQSGGLMAILTCRSCRSVDGVHSSHLETVDDSVHVMLAHDKKKQARSGGEPRGYVPRAAHPALEKLKQEKAAEGTGEADGKSENGGSNLPQEKSRKDAAEMGTASSAS